MGAALTFDQLRGAPRGTPWWQNPTLNRIARHPAIRTAIALAQADAAAAEMRTDPGLQAANALLNHPAAQQIMGQTDALWGRAAPAIWGDFTAGSSYGLALQANEVYPALSDVLSHAAGRPIDAGSLTPDEAAEILESYQAQLDEEVSPAAVSEVTEGNTRIVARESAEEVDCFEVPEGADREEFERQLKEQEDAINNTDIEQLQQRRTDFLRGDAKRDLGAQRQARREWITRRTRELIDTQSITRSVADATARREATALDATHILDMVAGGDPSAISGLGNSRINRSIGAQWRGRRARQLDGLLEEQARKGHKKPKIDLEVCD